MGCNSSNQVNPDETSDTIKQSTNTQLDENINEEDFKKTTVTPLYNNSIKYVDEDFSNNKVIPDNSEITEWKNLIENLESKKDLKTYVLSRQRTSFNSLSELKTYLDNSPAKNDLEKAYAIFLWISHNIDYDCQSFFSGHYPSQDADNVFKIGLSVCSGYADLARDIFESLNIKCKIIRGYAKGLGYEIGQEFNETNHDWNAVFINNKWNLIECTWASGYVDAYKQSYLRHFNPYYFFVPSKVFIHEHFPVDSENQYLKPSISMSHFENLPKYGPKFFIDGYKCLNQYESLIEPEKNTFKLEFQAPNNIFMIGYLRKMNNENISDSVFIQRDLNSENMIIDVSLQSNDKCKICLYGGKKGSKSLDPIIDYVIKPKNIIKKSFSYCTYFPFPTDIYLYEPKEKVLKIKTEYLFRIKVIAIEVVLVDGKNSWIQFEKDSSNEWILKYTPEFEGDLIVFAKITNEQSHSSAYKYLVSK